MPDSERNLLHRRVARLRALTDPYPSLVDAAAALGVSAALLRRNVQRQTATPDGLDEIERAAQKPM